MKANVKDMGAKTASLIMLGLSLFFIGGGVHESLLAYYISLTSSTRLNLSEILFQTSSLLGIAVGFVFLALASFVWDWKKNWKTLGVYICIAGLNFIVQSLDTALHPPFKELSPFDKMFPTSIIVGFITAAITCLAVGMLIVHLTRKARAA
jgi:hypothetical protein